MTKIEINTSDLNICLATLSLYICGYGLVSYVVKHRLYLSEPLIACLFGIIVGPAVLGWVDPNLWKPEEDRLMGYKDSLTLTLTRITIGIQVFFAGVALPKKYLKLQIQSLIMLLFPIMTIAWLVCGFLIYELIPGLTFMEALLISACITPTDPILANSITKGKYAEQSVHPRVRDIIVAESGANDGLGYPFIFLPLFAIMARSSEEFDAPNRHLSGIIARWIYQTWLYEVALSVVLGLLIGWVARKSLRWCEEHHMLDEDNFIAYGIGLSFFCLGFLGVIGSDDLLCCFIAGNSFSWDDRQRIAAEDAGFQDIIDMLLNAAIFMYIGAIMPWYAFNDPVTGIVPWRIVTLAVCVLLFRRLPWVVAIYKSIPVISSLKEAIFIGWFGPIGVSAIFYVQIALEYLPKDSRDQVKKTVEPVVYFMVFSSILVHGITVPASKVLMRGVTLTRTLTQSGLIEKRRSSAGPVTVDDIKRIGVAIPLPVYNSETGGRVSGSQNQTRTHTPRAASPEMSDLDTNRGYPEPGHPPGSQGRAVAFQSPA
ncbi:transporter, monovalent cation:proton antiporter-2 (CPA2) family protein [Rhizoctonia solani 123E]|uniref:Transporter, monovalent cation:proton antiporter-2 (CPA2) family protein n=1 Tax=Rhizoctonia solani 123E TaxID=1423351 RepID=A0A074S573_9AGAM|nr:transporter, monovalent cation:proton antiporter-2 (CPA2) family protein [Rhizoctonia solani 123E]